MRLEGAQYGFTLGFVSIRTSDFIQLEIDLYKQKSSVMPHPRHQYYMQAVLDGQ